MISKYDVIKSFERLEKKGANLKLRLSEDKKDVLDGETGKRLCSIDTYLDYARKELHCDFESVYYDHASLTDIYRCRQCGTVIFGGDDERYDPDCRCPTCCNDTSVCKNEFWTADEIEQDENKQKEIAVLEKLEQENREAAARREARNGLYDWQRWIKKFKTKNHMIKISYINFGWGHKNVKQDKHIEIMDYVREEDGHFVYGKDKGHCIIIPLNFYAFYLRHIFPYSKKCPENTRKYHFWQKKPKMESSACV